MMDDNPKREMREEMGSEETRTEEQNKKSRALPLSPLHFSFRGLSSLRPIRHRW